jgi:RNA polymerase sigma factor (sigma-70 family)
MSRGHPTGDAGGTEAPDPLLEALASGDPAAVAEASSVIRNAVFFRGFYIPESERSDVVQEAMVQLWRALADPSRPRPRDARAFIRSIAYRRCVDWMRRHRAAEPLEVHHAGQEASQEARLLRAEELLLGRETLARLQEPCRELFWLRAGRKLSYSEIGRLQGRTEKAARNQMSDCLGRAREILGKLQRRARLGIRPTGVGDET